jgi:uridine monophosphate synthetase
MGFFTRLAERARQVDSLLCVGLDPHPLDLTEPSPEAAHDFCLRLIEATADLTLAFKPNAGFFEAFGSEGYAVLKAVIAAVPSGIPVILDAKRGDIASSAQAYAQAAFQVLGAHAVTVNPYLGNDAIEPFLADPERGVFLLCKTSNPGAADLQDLRIISREDIEPLRLYEYIARLALQWNTRDNLGLVVGATHPQALGQVRNLAPDLWILAPGVGAQGGDLRAALLVGLRQDGAGLLIPVSRSLSRAESPRRAAEEICRAINQAREEIGELRAESRGRTPIESRFSTLVSPLSTLASGLLDSGCVQFGQFTLKSGLQSPIYIDLRRLAGYPGLLSQVASAYLPLLHKLTFDRLAALPYAAIPIATAISLQGNWPMIYPRKEAKAYGTQAEIEGVFKPGESAVVIDDLATTGGSKFEAIEKLTSAGLHVRDVVVLIDRQSGAADSLAQAGYHLHAVFTLTELLAEWERTGKISVDQVSCVRDFLQANG